MLCARKRIAALLGQGELLQDLVTVLETVEKLAIDFEAKFKVGTGFQPVRIGWKPTPRSCRSTT
jgi:hypothetical protein